MKLICLLLASGSTAFALSCTSVSNVNVNGAEITVGKGCYYSAYGLASAYPGEEPLIYDVYYLAGKARAVGPVMVRVHGGGWGGPTYQVSGAYAGTFVGGGCYTSTNCLSFFQQVLSGSVSGEGTPPVAIYDVNYTMAEIRFLLQPLSSTATTAYVQGCFAGCWSWPTSGTFQAVIDQGLFTQETITVTAVAGTNNPYSPSSVTFTRGFPAFPHNQINPILGNPAILDAPGYGCSPNGGPYDITFSQPFTGGNWTMLPTATYTCNATGQVTQGNLRVTSNGLPGLATQMPNTVSYSDYSCPGSPVPCTGAATPSGGGITGLGVIPFGSAIVIPDTQFPTAQNNIAGFFAYLAHCSVGGSSPGSGSCSNFSTEPAPGNPLDIRITGDSAGAQLALTAAWSGSTFLDNTIGTPGYSEFPDTRWKITAAAPWSVPVDMAYMYDGAITRAAVYALQGVLGFPITPGREAAMSPLTYLAGSSPRSLLVNGSGDLITSPVQVLEASTVQPSLVTADIIPACPPESPAITLTSGVDSSATTIETSAIVAGSLGELFVGLDSGPNYEVVEVSSGVNSESVGIVRGQFGTAAVSHSSGANVQNGACNHELDTGTWTVPGYTLGAVIDFLFPPATSFSPCDISHFRPANVADIQTTINEALGVSLAVDDLNDDAVVNVVDVQIVTNAAMGQGCRA